MTHCPWYITATAVRDYLSITRQPTVDDGPIFDAAEAELIEQAIAIVKAGKVPQQFDSGALQFRGGRPLRLRYIVTPAPRKEGDLPQLVRVKPSHER